MSSSNRITCGKGEPEELSLSARIRQRRKSPNRGTQQDMDQQPTGFAEGLDQLQQEAVVHVSPLPVQPPRPTFSRVYYRSHNWRKTTLQEVICSSHG